MTETASSGGYGTRLAARLWTYQRERFPLAAYAPMVLVFTTAAAAYSRVARGAPGWVPAERLAIGAFTALVMFGWLRILDEHKDAALDRVARPELPVPRGLVSLAELRWVGGAMLVATVALNAWMAPRLLWALLLIAGYAALMTREFFVGEWLRAHPTAYLLSHMMIMPLIDAYTTGLDWLAAGAHPPSALGPFLLLTFGNGVVVEIGRKIRPPELERPGVDTYTRAWGVRVAPLVWLATLVLTAAVAWVALRAIGGGTLLELLLLICALAAALPALGFLRTRTPRWAKGIEAASGAWTIAMYLLLGAGALAARSSG